MRSFMKSQSIFAMTLLCPLSMIAMFHVPKMSQNFPQIRYENMTCTYEQSRRFGQISFMKY